MYGFCYLPPGSRSYQPRKEPTNPEDITVIPLVLFCSLRFFSIATMLIPLTQLAELYPVKLRSVATGFTTATTNIQTFIAMKTLLNLETWITLPGAFTVYFVTGFIGLIITYYVMPETEGRSLEDIEVHFSDNSRSLFDRKIARQNHAQIQHSTENTKNGCTNNAYVPDHEK